MANFAGTCTSDNKGLLLLLLLLLLNQERILKDSVHYPILIESISEIQDLHNSSIQKQQQV